MVALWGRTHLSMQEIRVRSLHWEDNGSPFQHSCLGNPMDRGTWGRKRVGHNLATQQQQQAKRKVLNNEMSRWL